MTKFKIGIDIGGTNTDLVLVDNCDKIVYAKKTTTTDPVDKGFSFLLTSIFQDGEFDVKPEQISGVFVGTTHAVNAVLQRKNLFKVGVIRLTGNAGKFLEPCYGWPQDLKDTILAGYEIVNGGYYCDAREIAPINKDKIIACVENLLKKGAESFAIIGTYSPIKNDQEVLVAQLIKEVSGKALQVKQETISGLDLYGVSLQGQQELVSGVGGFGESLINSCAPVCISSDIGGTGFIERENATILNAALKKCMKSGFHALEAAVKENNLSCPIFITQNNGTIIGIKDAIEYPILTISSGPTNSFVGASKLANLQDAVIADIGGTSTDVGIVINNFARRSLESTDIGGVKLNFPMPDVLSIGIGGGSYIRLNGESCAKESGSIAIGPDSAGRELMQHAKCFGGDKLTLTDIAIASKLVDIPGADASKICLKKEVATQVIETVKNKLLQMKKIMVGKKYDIPLVLVGGGALLFKNSEIANICIIPEFADVANAYGAALAEISGTVDTVVKLDNRQEILNKLIEQAMQKAVENGAQERSLRLVDKQVLPFSYIPGNLARVKITVVGKMR